MKRIPYAAVALVLLFSLSARAEAGPAGSLANRSGYLSVGMGGGFMMDPDMGAGIFGLDYYVTDDISIGPYFQIGSGSHNDYWAVSGQVKFSPALAGNQRIRPYWTAGIGFANLDFADRRDTEEEDDITYLFPIGGGIEFELTDVLSADMGAVWNLTEDSFSGLTLGMRFLL